MNGKVQIIKQDGKPVFAVLPYEDFKALKGALEDARDAGLIDRFHAKLASGDEELIPEEYARRLIKGENPVRIWREFRGMTPQQIADACGVTGSAISMIEQGKRQPSVDLLKQHRPGCQAADRAVEGLAVHAVYGDRHHSAGCVSADRHLASGAPHGGEPVRRYWSDRIPDPLTEVDIALPRPPTRVHGSSGPIGSAAATGG